MKTNKDRIIREWSGQGHIYKSYQLFKKKSKRTCYIPELSDKRYNYYDFLRIAQDDEIMAKTLFEMCDWQHPETLYIELT